MTGWAQAARAALAEGPAALVTILATEGSAPRGAGTRMVVSAQASSGTIGGGRLELQAIDQARAILTLPSGAWRMQDYPLGPLLGQCCGGRVRLLVERLGDVAWVDRVSEGVLSRLEEGRIDRVLHQPASPSTMRAPRWMPEQARDDDRGDSPVVAARGPLPTAGTYFIEPGDAPRRPLLLFGAGHVGRAVARLMPGLPLHLAWYDVRPEADVPGVVVESEDALVACARAAPGEAALLVMTHDHGMDYRLVAAALAGEARFVGLIGSATKRARFLARLARDGIDAGRLTCPIGLAGIDGNEPAVIAVAAVAQLLALREEG